MTGQSVPTRILRKNVGDLSIPQEIAESLCSCGGLDGLANRLPPDDIIGQMRDWYQACADTVRLKILCLLVVHPLCVCVIKALTGIADSKLSYHLAIVYTAKVPPLRSRGRSPAPSRCTRWRGC